MPSPSVSAIPILFSAFATNPRLTGIAVVTAIAEVREHLAGAVTGLWHSHLWQGEKKPVDFFVVKGILEGLFEKLGISSAVEFRQSEKEGMHPGRTAEIYLSGTSIREPPAISNLAMNKFSKAFSRFKGK